VGCRDCGSPLPLQVGSGRRRVFCVACRPPTYVKVTSPKPRRAVLPSEPKLRCSACGSAMWIGKGTLSAGSATCQKCRRSAWPTCFCGAQCPGRDRSFCSMACSALAIGKLKRVRADDDHRTQRHERERTAPGLSQAARNRLLARWIRQCRQCLYCKAPATTIDHVVPLARGGTNFEGNLAPACKPCNSSKWAWTVVQWRSRKAR
jgi:5-methylcytosine-specific restriction endonuclease McrA